MLTKLVLNRGRIVSSISFKCLKSAATEASSSSSNSSSSSSSNLNGNGVVLSTKPNDEILLKDGVNDKYTQLYDEGLEASTHHHFEGEVIRQRVDVELGENHHFHGRAIRDKEPTIIHSHDEDVSSTLGKANRRKVNAKANEISSKSKGEASMQLQSAPTGREKKHSYLLSLFETTQVILDKTKFVEDLAIEEASVYKADVKSAHLQGGQYIRQIESEIQQHQKALEEYLQTVKVLVQSNRGTSPGFIQKILASWYHPMLKGVQEEIKNIKDDVWGLDRKQVDTISKSFAHLLTLFLPLISIFLIIFL